MRDPAFIIDLFVFFNFIIIVSFYRKTLVRKKDGVDYIFVLFCLNLGIVVTDVLINIFIVVQDNHKSPVFSVCKIICVVVILFLYCSLRLNFMYYIWDINSAMNRKKYPIHIAAWVLSIVDGTFGGRHFFREFIPEIFAADIALGRVEWIGTICGYLIWCMVIYYILKYWKKMGIRNTLILLEYPLILMIGFLIRPFWIASLFIALGTTSVLQIIYHVVCVNQAMQAREQERELVDARIQLALSQIGSHFIYNVLNSIYVLCGKDPKLAQKEIVTFSNYLRSNTENLEHERMIPFRKEMNHVRAYLELEKMRFYGELESEEDLRITEFDVPAFTIQPLVENAVKHGLQPKEGKGTVRIRTTEEENAYVVEVTDDGVGFSADDFPRMDETHVGIRNVKKKTGFDLGGNLKYRRKKRRGDFCDGQNPQKQKHRIKRSWGL